MVNGIFGNLFSEVKNGLTRAFKTLILFGVEEEDIVNLFAGDVLNSIHRCDSSGGTVALALAGYRVIWG
jgi:hypothetical protein